MMPITIAKTNARMASLPNSSSAVRTMIHTDPATAAFTPARSGSLDAKLVRKAGIPVFIGGPHVTYMPEEALQYADYVMRGEADDVIVDFVKAIETGKGLDKIPGLSYMKDGQVKHNSTAPFCKDLDTIPAPDFGIIQGLEHEGARLTISPIMTSRGCPYDCSFCSVTGMFGQKYRFRSKERVLEELQNHRKFGGDWVFFYDDNFCAHKKRTKELLHTMIQKKLTPNWTAQVRVEVAKDPELMDLMVRSKCHTVYIGLESINPEIWDNVTAVNPSGLFLAEANLAISLFCPIPTEQVSFSFSLISFLIFSAKLSAFS